MSGKTKKDYHIGKGLPPPQHRFPKGVSGNPKGRPRKRRPEEVPAAHEPFMADMLLDVAFRPIPSRLPDGTEEQLTIAEAITRKLAEKALKGNVQAARKFLGDLARIERERVTAATQVFGSAMIQKLEREHELERWIARGFREEDFLLHPDDIVLDPEKFTVVIGGPTTPRELRMQQTVIAHRDRIAEKLKPSSEFRRMIGKSRSLLKFLYEAEVNYDFLDQLLAPRLRRPRQTDS